MTLQIQFQQYRSACRATNITLKISYASHIYIPRKENVKIDTQFLFHLKPWKYLAQNLQCRNKTSAVKNLWVLCFSPFSFNSGYTII